MFEIALLDVLKLSNKDITTTLIGIVRVTLLLTLSTFRNII